MVHYLSIMLPLVALVVTAGWIWLAHYSWRTENRSVAILSVGLYVFLVASLAQLLGFEVVETLQQYVDIPIAGRR